MSINNFIRPQDFGSDRKDINRILEMIHDVVAPEAEDAALQQRIAATEHIKLRTTTVIFGGANLLNTDVRTREAFNWRRKKPIDCPAYDLIHTQVGEGTLTFPISE